MNSLIILLIGAQFGSILTQEEGEPDPGYGEEPQNPDGGDDAQKEGGDATSAAPDGGDDSTTAAGDDKTTDAGTTAASETTTAKTTKSPTKATPKPTKPVKCRSCYRNQNGICRTFDIACRKKGLNLRDKNGIKWTLSRGDCANRAANEAKICSSDCRRFKTANCRAAPTPVCGYSKKRKMCRKYPSLCHLKKNACNNPAIGDWRVAKMSACRGLKVGAPAVRCSL
ncbi:uncharacterized protein ACRADG_008686 [Cochliomyia hominivorax]